MVIKLDMHLTDLRDYFTKEIISGWCKNFFGTLNKAKLSNARAWIRIPETAEPHAKRFCVTT